MLYLVIILIGLGIIVAMFTVLTRKGGDEEDVLVGQADTCATCDGTNTQCEQKCMMEAATKEIEYFDDEELDAFRQRPADGYSDEEAEMFREVMYSMRQEEVADWNRSLILRGINVPDQLKDELIMLLGD